jgi:hypothetical protein
MSARHTEAAVSFPPIMTGHVADLSWKSGARVIEKLDRLRSTMAVNVLIPSEQLYIQSYYHHKQLIPEQHIGEHNPIYQLIHIYTICHFSPD